MSSTYVVIDDVASSKSISNFEIILTRSYSRNIVEKTIVHYNDVIMDTIPSQITSLTIVYSIVYSDADQRKHQSSASLFFVWGIHRGPVNSPHKWPVTRKMFPFDDVIMIICGSWDISLAHSSFGSEDGQTSKLEIVFGNCKKLCYVHDGFYFISKMNNRWQIM